MPGGPSHKLLWQLRGLVQAGSEDVHTDESLLDQFVAHKDEAAFAALVHRHGPTVWGVCRRMVNRVPDAEDAFQATFLVLARKAGSVRKGGSLGSWLHGVACRVARKVRADAARRDSPSPVSASAAEGPEVEVSWREVRSVLDEELELLPDKYKAPVLLCYLEGLTRDEAAARLGWPPGVLRGRLERGRLRLRARLARRGLALLAGLVGAALGSPARAVPARLAVAAVKAAADPASRSPQVVALCEGVVRAMMLNKLKLTAVVVVLLGLAGLTAGLASGTLSAQDDPSKPSVAGPVRPGTPAPDLERRVAELEKKVLQLTQEVQELRGTKKKDYDKGPTGEGQMKVIPLKLMPARRAADTLMELIGGKSSGRILIEVDDRTNSLVVRGSPSDLEEVTQLLEKMEKPARAAEAGNAQLQVFPLMNTVAEDVVKLLEKVYPEKKLRAAAVGSKSLAVYGTAEELKEVGVLIYQLDSSVPQPMAPAKP